MAKPFLEDLPVYRARRVPLDDVLKLAAFGAVLLFGLTLWLGFHLGVNNQPSLDMTRRNVALAAFQNCNELFISAETENGYAAAYRKCTRLSRLAGEAVR